MGRGDAVTRDYLQNNEVFADVFNYQLFDGEPVIRPEELRELDPTRVIFLPDRRGEKFESPADAGLSNCSIGAGAPAATFGKTASADFASARYKNGPEENRSRNLGKRKNRKQKRRLKKEQDQSLYRDLLKNTVVRRDENAIYQLRLGMELQTKVNYAMPVRNQMYDAAEYYHQVNQIARAHERSQDYSGLQSGEFTSGFHKDDYLIPVFTLTVYFGAEPWDGPRSLHEMMRIQDPEVLKLIPDYRIHLIEPAGLEPEDLLKFQSNFREVMGYIKYSKDAGELISYTKNNPRMKMDISAARVIAAMTKTEIPYEEETEGQIDVCKAIEDMVAQAKEEGRVSGMEEGRSSGLAEGKKAGIAEGRASGFAEGKSSGITEGKIQTLAELVSDGVLTRADAAKRAGMTVEEFAGKCG